MSAELARRVPLLELLEFSRETSDEAAGLPPAIALFSLMTDPEIPGDACVLLPKREHVAAFTSVLSAFRAASESFPKLLEKYVVDSFEVGERVRVLPTGHVYLFDGYFEYSGSRFFKLRVMDDPSRAARSFPLHEAVRLEKTNRMLPKGKGDTDLGKFQKSKLDFVADTKTGGNNALQANEVVLVTTRNAFEEFIGSIHVARSDNPDHRFPLSEVIPWGTVNGAGEIEFRNSAAATGEPLIAVSPRTEYVAAFCRANGRDTPRVIVDGAGRIKDLQALDDMVDFGKLLVFADHSEADLLTEVSRHDCAIWKMPDNLNCLVEGGTSLLGSFREAYRRSGNFGIDVITCGSTGIDRIAEDIFYVERLLRENESDDQAMRFVSTAFARLLDVSALVHDPEKGELADLQESIGQTLSNLESQNIWIPEKAFVGLASVYENLRKFLDPSFAEARTSKKLALLDLANKLISDRVDFTIVGHNTTAADSAVRFFAAESVEEVRVVTLAEFLANPTGDQVVLTSWPRSRNLSKLVNGYSASQVHALGYEFEVAWFKGAARRRVHNLSRWGSSENTFVELTGLPAQLLPEQHAPDIPLPDESATSVIDLEQRLSSIRKGTRAGPMEPHEARDARYVGFVGRTYCYLTGTHGVPKVTGVIRGSHKVSARVPIETVDGLAPGDLVLFRVHADSDRDMIRFMAEQFSPPGEYEEIRKKAELWKDSLRSIAHSPVDIAWKLQNAGLNRTGQAVRIWLTDPNLIGPGYEADLELIARVAGDDDFLKQVPEVWKAVQTIRGAHTSAGFKLSELLVRQLPQQIPELAEEETVVELTLEDIPLGNVAIVEIEDISDASEPRPHWEVNRIFWEQN